MELRQFRQFIAVADEMSFRRAAVRLHMSQPPLTAAIKKMEAEMASDLESRRKAETFRVLDPAKPPSKRRALPRTLRYSSAPFSSSSPTPSSSSSQQTVK